MQADKDFATQNCFAIIVITWELVEIGKLKPYPNYFDSLSVY